MITKSLLISSLIISSGFSLGLDDIVNDALKNSYDLQKLNKNLQITNEDIKLSDKWNNPTISIGANDIHFDTPFARDKEAMQSNYVSISQVIPINGKLKYKKNIAIQDNNIAHMDLENKKLQLSSLIYEYGYKILINKQKLALINEYQKNTKKLHEIGLSLYESGKVNQIVPLKTDLLSSKLEIQKENIKFELKNLNTKLEQITYKEVLGLDDSIELNEIHAIKSDISSHPVLVSIEYNKIKFNNLALLEESKKYSDIKVNLGYFSRDDKFEDYANLSFSMPLPIYGNEEAKVAKARYQASKTQDDLKIIKTQFEKNFSTLKEEMKKSFINYQTLSINMIPQREFIQKNIHSHYRLGHMKSVDLLSNINETISLELLALDELSKYYSAYAKSKYYTGIKK